MHEELLLPLCFLDLGFGSVSLGLRECNQSAEWGYGVVTGALCRYGYKFDLHTRRRFDGHLCR